MKRIYLFWLLLLCNFISFYGQANAIPDKKASMLLVENAYIRATIPGTSNSSAYMKINNKGENVVSLLSASSDISSRIEIHQHTMEGGMMRMRKLNSIDINPKEHVKLQPSGLHLMVFDVKNPLKPKQRVEVTLNFSNNESVTMHIPVYSMAQEQASQKSVSKMHEHHH